MDKTAALARLTTLEAEANEIRKILEAPERAASLLTKPVPLSGSEYWRLDKNTCTAGFNTQDDRAVDSTSYPGGNIFQSEKLAKDYAEAINTMLLLRHQPGTEPVSGRDQYVIQPSGALTVVEAICYLNPNMKLARLSPSFSTKDHAIAAIESVGMARIMKMFKDLHHFG